MKVFGWIGENGDPKEPVYEIGPVLKSGKNLDRPGRNHYADYIDKTGGYDIVRYLTDFAERFPSLNHIGIGQLAPHVTTGVDCESLFSQSRFLSHPQKNRLQRIYFHIPDVIRLYMERHSKNGTVKT